MRADPGARFVIGELAADLATGEVELGYRLESETSVHTFTERVTLPVPPQAPDEDTRDAVHAVLTLLHAVAGVSYFKVAAPLHVDVGSPMTPAEHAFVQHVYRDGMAEFAYVNDLPSVLGTEVHADVVRSATPRPVVGDASRPLVPCGGGKDSIVSAELLLGAGLRPTSFAVNPDTIIRDVVDVSGTPLLEASRTLDPLLFELNAQGALNGHVPVTAVNSLIAVAVSLLHGLGPVLMSNESSASAPNLVWQGVAVNHQWSKSLDAERLLQSALLSRLDAEFVYGSLLRSLNEFEIAAQLARFPKYDHVVTSCNKAFLILNRSGKRWCLECPKCQFVTLALAPFFEPERLRGVFGGNMLDDLDNLAGYAELVGLQAAKPFECVGEVDECAAAMLHLDGTEDRRYAVVRELAPQLRAAGRTGTPWEALMAQRGPSLLPAMYQDTVDAAR